MSSGSLYCATKVRTDVSEEHRLHLQCNETLEYSQLVARCASRWTAKRASCIHLHGRVHPLTWSCFDCRFFVECALISLSIEGYYVGRFHDGVNDESTEINNSTLTH
jgi:hypothetical protein